MKLFLLSMMAMIPCLAQFRFIEIRFKGIGCASCVESLQSRIERMRGVQSASVDSAGGVLKIQLEEQNRVRLEQVRDLIEQDGTKVTEATVRLKGELSRVDDKWILRPAGLTTTYEIEGKATPALPTGTCRVTGSITQLRPGGGTLIIRATAVEPTE